MDTDEASAHIVLLSSPGMGHLIPVMELGKRFHTHHNFKVTILTLTSPETHLLQSSTHNLITLLQIPSPDVSHLLHPNATVFTRLCLMTRASLPAVRHALSNLTATTTLRPTTLIVDLFFREALPLAQEFNMLKYIFVASHAWLLCLCLYSPTLDKQVEGQYVDQKEPFNIPGCRPVRPQDLVGPMLDRNDQQYQEYLGIVAGLAKVDGVLVNTWESLQPKELHSLRDEALLGRILKGPVYSVGPIVRETDAGKSEWVVKWLDRQPNESVIYVSFGSGGTLSYEQMTELAFGLELCAQRFVWVVRPPTGGAVDAAFFSTGVHGTDEMANYMPKGFLSRTRERGVVVSQWAPQAFILRHPSVGGFLSHCGWNSTLESLTNGVPMIAWPLYAEQKMNATLLADELGVAVRPEVLPAKKVVGREEIASMVRKIMVAEEEEGGKNNKNNPIRERVKEIKRSAVEALSEGGTSYVALSVVAKTVLIGPRGLSGGPYP